MGNLHKIQMKLGRDAPGMLESLKLTRDEFKA